MDKKQNVSEKLTNKKPFLYPRSKPKSELRIKINKLKILGSNKEKGDLDIRRDKGKWIWIYCLEVIIV